MNLSKLIQMVINIVMRKAINKGVAVGVGYASRRGKSQGAMTPDDLAQAHDAKQMAERAKQAAKLARKLGR